MERVDLSKQALEHHASFLPDPDQGQPRDQVKPPSDIVAVILASFVSQLWPITSAANLPVQAGRAESY